MMGFGKCREKTPKGASWSGAAFLVESMLLLVLLAVSMSVLVQVFGLSLQRSHESEELSRAIAAAEDAAERFASDPAAAEGTIDVDGLRVVCEVDEESQHHGTFYRATISVYDFGEPDAGQGALYALSTARYVSEVSR
jgi:type II secretory pathway pseudopilin PulG